MPQHSDEFIPTRLSLLSRLQNWDAQASWRDFFDTYWRLIYRAAIKSSLPNAEAQDVLQETVITVAKKLGVNVGLVYLAKHRISALLKKEIKVLETKTVWNFGHEEAQKTQKRYW